MSLAKKIFDGGISPLKTRLLYGAGLGLIIFLIFIISNLPHQGDISVILIIYLIIVLIYGSILALILHFILKVTGLERKLPYHFFILLIVFYLLIGVSFYYSSTNSEIERKHTYDMYNWQKMDDCSREFSKDDICYNPENSYLAIPENQLFCKYCVDGGTKTTFFELPMDQRREEIRRCHCISNLQLHPSVPTTQWFNAHPPEKDSSLFQDPKYYSLIWAWMPHTSNIALYGIMIIMHLLGGGRI